MDGDSGGTPNPLNPNNSNNEKKILVGEPEVEETIAESDMVEQLIANEPIHDSPTEELAEQPAKKLVDKSTEELVDEPLEEAVLDANHSEIIEDIQEEPESTKETTEPAKEKQVEPEIINAAPEVIGINRPEKIQVNRSETVRVGGEIIPPVGAKKLPVNPMHQSENQADQIEDFEFQSIKADATSRPEPGLTESVEQIGQIETLREEIDPMNRPMEKAITPEPVKPKKKEVGVIIGVIISLFIAVGCGVAAVLLSNQKNADPVAKAIGKILSGNAPKNIAYDGTLDLNIYNQFSPISNAKIDLNGEAIIGPMINSSTAEVSASLRNGGSFSFSLNESYAANGDIYFKVNGVSNILSDQNLMNGITGVSESAPNTTENAETLEATTESISETNCADDGSCVTTEISTTQSNSLADNITSLLAVAEVIDGEWVKAPVDSLSSVVSGGSEGNPLNCMAGLMTNAVNNSNSLAGAYNKNPFIASSTKNIPVVSQQNPIYQVIIDNEKLTGFINSIQGNSAMDDFYTCLGYKNATVNTDNIVALFNNLPPIYVEINNNDDITRLYLEVNNSEDFSAKLDFYFTYPANVNVPEPTQYTTVDDVYKNIVNKMLTNNTATN